MNFKDIGMDMDPSKEYRMTTYVVGPEANVNPPPDFNIDEPIPFSLTDDRATEIPEATP